MTGIFCIATGSATYLQFALNLGLSIKANSNIDTVLLYTNDALADLKWDAQTVERRFGYAFDKKMSITVKELYGNKGPLGQAHFIKLSIYHIAIQLGYDEVIILDSDTLMVPSKSPDIWFNELKDANFSTYCNAYFDFKTGKQSKAGYTFWCEPLEAMDYFKLEDKMPQINASFVYFKKSDEAKKIFDTAMDIWNMSDDDFEFERYNGIKTEEMCFNISCALHKIYPHKIPYQPLYFQYQHEENSSPYVTHFYPAISMAGNIIHTQDLILYYNQLTRYYRSLYGINDIFVFSNETKKPKDVPLDIEPLRRRTIWRRGELPNSEAGVFNPSGLVKDGKLYTIFRKEKSMEVYSHKYTHSTAVPHLCIDGDEGVELELVGMPDKSRCEDFRLFGDMWVSHTLVTNMTNDTIYSKLALSYVEGDERLVFHSIPQLPAKTNVSEKNWVFFDEIGMVWCIYSLNPYRIFYTEDLKEWKEFKVKDPRMKWWQNNKFICNSSNPILVDGSWLMFYHSKDAGIYSHGACLIDKETKEITHYFRNGFPVKVWGEGLQKNLIYVSGAVYLKDENILRIFYGESDSHSCYNDYDAEKFIKELRKYKA